jgi:hypothetical protein
MVFILVCGCGCGGGGGGGYGGFGGGGDREGDRRSRIFMGGPTEAACPSSVVGWAGLGWRYLQMGQLNFQMGCHCMNFSLRKSISRPSSIVNV